jgi:transcription initiation factor TFIIH subunit 3
MFGFASSSAPAESQSTAAGSSSSAGAASAAGGPGTTVRADAASVNQLLAPSADAVDFRAACFCHRRVVDTGFVCSICLSIFCEVPEGAECLTCGTKLALGNYGAKPAVVPRQRKKKRRRLGINSEGREESYSVAGTPRPG